VTYLTLDDLYAMVERMFGPTRMVRDAGLLDAPAYRPQATMFGDGWRLQLPHGEAAVDLVLAVATGATDLHRIATTLESWARTAPAAQ
jgi:hypothetical protein